MHAATHKEVCEQSKHTPCIIYASTFQPQQVVAIDPKHIVTDYRLFAIITTVIFAILGPLSLVTGIPAVIFAIKVGNCFGK